MEREGAVNLSLGGSGLAHAQMRKVTITSRCTCDCRHLRLYHLTESPEQLCEVGTGASLSVEMMKPRHREVE